VRDQPVRDEQALVGEIEPGRSEDLHRGGNGGHANAAQAVEGGRREAGGRAEGQGRADRHRRPQGLRRRHQAGLHQVVVGPGGRLRAPGHTAGQWGGGPAWAFLQSAPRPRGGPCRGVLYLTLAVVFAILTVNVALRYVAGTSLSSASELPELLFPWMIMAGVVL